MKKPLINRPPQFQRQDCCKRHGQTLGQLGSAILTLALLAGTLALGAGCGKKAETPPVTSPQVAPAQPAAAAPVQRQQYAPTPTPAPAPAAPAQQSNPTYPAGVPMTKPAGSTKPVPVVP